MASLHALLFLVFVFDPGFSFILGEDQKTLNWPVEYNIRGEMTNLFTGIIKPFEIWHSVSINKSRIDFYDGMVKTFYVGENDEDLGQEYKIFPMTTDDVTNEIICQKDRYEGDLMNLLEMDENYTFIGETVYNNKEVEIWKLFKTDDEDNSKEEETLYAYQNGEGIYIPVFIERIKHNLWTGGLSRHTITRYFEIKPVLPEDLDVNQVEACNETMEAVPMQENDRHDHSNVDDDFLSYKIQHKRKYKKDEHEMRKQIFKQNLRKVIEHNQKNLGYKLTINKFSDRTEEELAHLMGTRPSNPLELGSMAFPHTEEEVDALANDLPESYDLRIEGFISPIKNQGDCGSCWAFSTTAAVEGALARSNGARDLDLSEQSLVDCAWGYSNFGCSGGIMDGVYKYVLKHGIPTEEDYGLYLEENGFCKLDNMTNIYRIKGFSRVPALSINAMKVALYKYGPVTVTINSSPVIHYSSGIYYNPECNNEMSNHAVTVVGYGVRDGTTYWIVKNSWGEDWGQDGYILFSATNNNCHILEDSFCPIV